MQQPNFKCPKTGKEFYIQQFRTVFSEGQTIYKDKYGKELINPDNGEVLVSIPKEGPIGVPMLAKYSHRSSSGLQNLKQHFGGRAGKFDSKGAGGEEKTQKNKEFKEELVKQIKRGKK